ncbi:hypothetical protein IQC45_19860, partial [Leptospira interrogans serovar Pomona]|nr:hypothetical protein [Leptospira interrogans serovar Pomona]
KKKKKNIKKRNKNFPGFYHEKKKEIKKKKGIMLKDMKNFLEKNEREKNEFETFKLKRKKSVAPIRYANVTVFFTDI